MPIQAPHWTDYLNCPVCFREFGPSPRSPVSLGCGHTLCENCLKNLHRKHCPFDQTVIQAEPEELAINTALLQLAGYTPPSQPLHPPCIQTLSESDIRAYDVIIRCLEHLAIYLKLCANNSVGNRLSRPMQRKLVTLLQCAITDEEGRGRAARAARSLGERSVTELILQHQNPQQLSANLWAAVRARGCQFLGPAMQEEVLKLVLLALDDGSALSRKVLVMFVVQRLEGDFPQASKTSIGHVVQLLYRASCFKVSKRECDSSLMQLKEEFRTYETLRREHDAQIVQIATEAGLRIAPDQWSALLYGDTAHKSHMQSIIDKLQTPQSFAQSVQELFIALQRSGDSAQLVVMSLPLDTLANIDPSPDATSPSWQVLAEIITAVKDVVSGLVSYLQQQTTGRDSNHNQKHTNQEKCSDTNTSQLSPQGGTSPPHRLKVAFCRDSNTRGGCPRGSNCNFLHYEDDMDRYRPAQNSGAVNNGNLTAIQLPPMSVPPPICSNSFPIPLYRHYPPPHLQQARMPAHMQVPHQDSYNVGHGMPSMPSPMSALPGSCPPPDIPLHAHNEAPRTEGITGVYAPGIITNPQLHLNQNNQLMVMPDTLLMAVPDRPYYGNYGLLTVVTDDNPNMMYKGPDYIHPVYQAPNSAGAMGTYQPQEHLIQPPMSNLFIPVPQEPTPYAFDDMNLPAGYRDPPGFPPLPRDGRYRVNPRIDPRNDPRNDPRVECLEPRGDPRVDPSWPRTSPYRFNQLAETMPPLPSTQGNCFDFNDMRDALPAIAGTSARSDNLYPMPNDRRAVGADRGLMHAERAPPLYPPIDPTVEADEHKLEEGLMALERRIDTEFKIT